MLSIHGHSPAFCSVSILITVSRFKIRQFAIFKFFWFCIKEMNLQKIIIGTSEQCTGMEGNTLGLEEDSVFLFLFMHIYSMTAFDKK